MTSKLELILSKNSKNNDVAIFKGIVDDPNGSPVSSDAKLELLPGELKKMDIFKLVTFLNAYSAMTSI